MAEKIANRYELRDRIDEDLVGEEYRAEGSGEHREVGLRLLKPETRGRSPENIFRYRRLLGELSKLRHENLSAVLEHGEWHDRDYVVFEWKDGAPLSKREGAALDPDAIVEIARGVCRALDAAHQQGILHGLLNPDGIWVDEKNVSRVRGFGMGLLLDLTRVREKSDVRRIFRYLSPEQSGILRRAADARSDLYSLGIVLYELLAGQPPYLSEEVNVLVSEHVSRSPASLRSLRPGVPELLEKITFRLIAKDPDDRYQTVAGVIADLDHFAAERQRGVAAADVVFEVGLNDRVRKPSFSTRLIGRDRELNELRGSLAGASEGLGNLVFIHGEPGIGKTRLINELRGEVHAAGGLFIGGKCSQYDAGMPFKVLSMAIEAYVDRVRRLSAADQARHIARIQENIGELGGEIVKLTPKIKELIGEPPALAEIEPNQQRTRFLLTVIQFLAGLGSGEKPVVIFLDDLQWSDEGSYELIERAAAKLEGKRLAVIASYRDNEPEAAEPVIRLQNKLKQGPSPLRVIHVQAFQSEETAEIVSRVLLAPPERIAPLAEYLR
ncbi:MAG: AAA family ATPase, partial [Verrucomicrobiae bacterium]|nr:AAA family ATPase [Verrucomicrobiae bacterium]